MIDGILEGFDGAEAVSLPQVGLDQEFTFWELFKQVAVLFESFVMFPGESQAFCGTEAASFQEFSAFYLGKFCYYGSVKVSEHAVIEKYARVFHSVSTVKGEVKEGTDIADMVKATFPGGSITGAPKIRSMEIIDELETVGRGIYTGSIGYIYRVLGQIGQNFKLFYSMSENLTNSFL